MILAWSLVALASPQVVIEALVVEDCDVQQPNEPVIDRAGPSIRLLRAAVTQIGEVEVVTSPFLLAPPEKRMEFSVENGEESFELVVTPTRQDQGWRMDMDAERVGADGLSNTALRGLWVPDDGLVALAGPGCTVVFVVPHAIETDEDVVERGADAEADVARHFEGLSPGERRRRARDLLAVSAATNLLL